jgi:hypothetical protein
MAYVVEEATTVWARDRPGVAVFDMLRPEVPLLGCGMFAATDLAIGLRGRVLSVRVLAVAG